ncbi:lipase [Bordetella ansorpii]|uniref:Lipase n=2 Tax=Bordetella ansorpii TaxID=288768 RepID=A0A157SJP1_9BORD|nr:lipase [Bordetella ansorpii]
MSPISYTPAPDGTPLANYLWEPAAGMAPPLPGPGTPSIYLLHGLSEHAGRYDRLARRLAALGWRVGMHDHRGHGRSEGAPATLATQEDLVLDAASQLRAWTAAQGRPPVLLGHSLGGLVAARIALQRRADLAGLVLASPPFQVRVPNWTKPALTWLALRYPDVRVPHGLPPGNITHDRAIVAAFKADPLVHRCITGRLAHFIEQGGRESLRDAGQLHCRTLLLVAGADRIVASKGSRIFASRAPAGLLTLKWYDGAWHELFNELPHVADQVHADLEQWLAGLAFDAAPAMAPAALSLQDVALPQAIDAVTP